MAKTTGIAATVIEGVEFPHDAPAGAIQYRIYGAVPDSTLYFTCPCGCGAVGHVFVRPFPKKPFWSNVGTREAPTIQPSIGFNRRERDEDVENDGYHWHGYLMEGVWHSVFEGRG